MFRQKDKNFKQEREVCQEEIKVLPKDRNLVSKEEIEVLPEKNTI